MQRNEADARAAEEARRAEFDRRAKANARRIDAPAVRTPKRDLMTEIDGEPTLLRKGSKLAATDPLVLANEDSFS